jgi:F5/8 type C domain
MAVQTIYILGTAGVTPNFFGNTQLNGTAPTAANSTFGWGPAKTAVTTPYYRGRLGQTTTGVDAAVASSYNAGTTGPTKGTNNTGAAGDSFIAGPFYGTFANTAWTFNCNLRAGTAGAIGHINMRFWRSPNADGSGATQITANTAGATITLSTTVDGNSSITWSPGQLVLVNQYLFFQVEWQETTAGSSNGNNVLFRIGTASITTADFVAAATGTLSATQAAQTVAATGTAPAVGTLAVTEIGDTLAASGGPRVGGTLAITEASDTIAAAGEPRVAGTLAITEASDTIAAAGGPVVSGISGALALTESSDTLAAAGTVIGAAPSNKLVLSFTPGTPRADFAGYVGVSFTPSVDLSFNRIGLRSGGASDPPRRWVSVYDQDATSMPVVNTGIDLTGGVAGTFYYTDTSPITLLAGHRYHLDAFVANDGTQFWADLGATTLRSQATSPTTSAALTPAGFAAFVGTANSQYYGVDLDYVERIYTRVSPINMWANNQPVPYVVSASGSYVGGAYEPANAFDGNPATMAHSDTDLATKPYWIKIDLGRRTFVNQYKYQSRSDGVYHQWKTWVLEGSNDDSSWTLVDTIVNELVFLASEVRTYVCDAPGTFRYWRWTVTASQATYADCASLELWSAVPPPAPGLVAHAEGINPATSTPAIDTTGANLLLLEFVWYGGVAEPSFTDSYGNTWTRLGGQQGDGNFAAYTTIYYVNSQTPNTGSGHTINWTDSSGSPTFYFSAWRSAKPWAFDEIHSLGGLGPLTPRPTISPTAGKLIATFAGTNRHYFTGLNSGWTFINNAPFIDTVTFGSAYAYLTDQAVTTADAIWQLDYDTSYYSYQIVSFNGYWGTHQQDQTLAATGSIRHLVRSYNPDYDRNDFTGRVGVTFTATAAATYNQIGLRCGTSNTGLHTVALYDSGGTLLRTANVDLTGKSVGTFYYAPIASIALNNGSTYYLATTVTSGDGQPWPTDGPTTLTSSTNIQSAYYDGSWHTYQADRQYYGVDLGYIEPPGAITGTLAVTESSDTLTAAGNVPVAGITGTLAVTEAADTIVAAGGPRVGGTLAANQAAQTLAAAAGPVVGGALSAAQAANTIVAAGGPRVGGTLTANQAAQTLAAAAGPVVGGALSASQAAQTLVAAGGPRVGGTLAATEAADTIAASGSVLTGASGTLALTQAAQTLVATGSAPYVATLALTEALDTIAAAGGVVVRGTLTATEAVDTIAASGGPVAQGTLSATQAAHTIVAAGGPRVGGTLSTAQAANTIAALGSVTVQGTLSIPQAAQTLAAAGSVLSGVGGALTLTQAAQALVATGTVPLAVIGTLAVTQAAHTIVAAGGPRVGGTLTANQAAQTLAAAAGPVVQGTLSATQAAHTLAAAGSVIVRGTLAATQAAQTLAAAGRSTIGGALNVAQAAHMLTARGDVVASAHLNLAQAAHTVAAGGVIGTVTCLLRITQADNNLDGVGFARILNQPILPIIEDGRHVVAGAEDRWAETANVARVASTNGAARTAVSAAAVRSVIADQARRSVTTT